MKNIKILIITIILSLISCKKEEKEIKENNNDIPVKILNVENEKLNTNISSHGLLTSGEEVNLSFKNTGIIKHIYAKEGDVIHKGMLLAELDFTEITAREVQIYQNYEKALREQQRMQNLYKDNVISLEVLENSKTAVNVLQESLNMIKFDKKYSRILAPEDGVIIKKYASENELINTGVPVFLISSEGSNGFIIKASVSAIDRFKIKIGDEAKVKIEVYPDKQFRGTVKRINRYVDKLSGLYTLDIQVEQQDVKIEEGMFALVDIIINEEKQYKVVPAITISEGEGNRAFVYILDKGKYVKKIPIKIAFIKDGKAFIESGLENINKIITEGSGFLSENSTITIK